MYLMLLLNCLKFFSILCWLTYTFLIRWVLAQKRSVTLTNWTVFGISFVAWNGWRRRRGPTSSTSRTSSSTTCSVRTRHRETTCWRPSGLSWHSPRPKFSGYELTTLRGGDLDRLRQHPHAEVRSDHLELCPLTFLKDSRDDLVIYVINLLYVVRNV